MIVLSALACVANIHANGSRAASRTVIAIGVAALLDALIIRIRARRWRIPDGAILTGLIIAMILSPQEPLRIVAVTSGVGVVSKYAFRTRSANIFNPAAFALVVTFYVYNTGQSWWGALSDYPWPALLALLLVGTYVADRVNKGLAVLSFLAVYYLLGTLATFVADPLQVAELFRVPDVNAALFFAFFMVTDPPTSPPKARDQLLFGAITGAVSFVAYALVGMACFLLVGLLVANAWEAARRHRRAHAMLDERNRRVNSRRSGGKYRSTALWSVDREGGSRRFSP